MIKLEINDKKYKVPESFSELSLSQYCKIFYKLPHPKDDDDKLEFERIVRKNESIILSRLLGEDDEFCLSLPLNVYAYINEKMRYLYDTDFFMRNAKAGIVIDGHRYSVPPFNEMPLRQYIDADMLMKEEENDDQYIQLLSILLTRKNKDGKWEKRPHEDEELYGKLKDMPCSETLGLVYHFFKKSHALSVISKASMKVEETPYVPHTQDS